MILVGSRADFHPRVVHFADTMGDRLIEGSRNSERARSRETNNTTIILFDEEDIKGVEECERSLVGKIIIEKLINKNSLQSAMQGIWGNP